MIILLVVLGAILFVILYFRKYRYYYEMNIGFDVLIARYKDMNDMDSIYKVAVLKMMKQDYISAHKGFEKVLLNYDSSSVVYTMEDLKMNLAFCLSPLPWSKSMQDKSGSYYFYRLLKRFGNRRSPWYPDINKEMNDAIEVGLNGNRGSRM